MDKPVRKSRAKKTATTADGEPKPTAASRKPPVVAKVTPDGIQGSLSAFVEQRPLIAHLPITASDIESDLFATNENTTQPKPYEPMDEFSNYGKSGAVTGEETVQPPPPQYTENQPTPTRATLPLNYAEKLMVRYQDANRDQRLPDTTDIACFWDCHQFRGVPCVIPICIKEDIWEVYGNFCSPECAAAHLFDEPLDAHVKWERYALLNRLYSGGGDPIHRASPRAILRLFGGTQDVSDFRALHAEKRMRVDVMLPPMISIIQVMDTKPIDFYDSSLKNTFIPWEMDRMNRPGAQGLRLRRTKPIAVKESTLEYCMGIVR
jgi:hypothetical protein